VWGLAAIKLILSIATFAVLGYLGSSHVKRIAGVLLTFQILNGIGILTAHEPLAAANSIYAVVVFNGASAVPRNFILSRAAAAAGHCFGASAIDRPRGDLDGAVERRRGRHHHTARGAIRSGSAPACDCAIAVIASLLVWKPARAGTESEAQRKMRMSAYARAFTLFWSNAAGGIRLGLFAFCCILLLVAANVFESKWVGMLSALPLPGLFAVATLSTLDTRDELVLVRDTVLWGPGGVQLDIRRDRRAAAGGAGIARGHRICTARGAAGARCSFDFLRRAADRQFLDSRRQLRTAAL
jgi:hypothetical protein